MDNIKISLFPRVSKPVVLGLAIVPSEGGGGGVGEDGKSAYELAVLGGFIGTVEAWLESLKGDPGESIKGDPGTPGATPIKGIDYFDGLKGDPGESIKGDPGTPGTTPQKGVDYFDGQNGQSAYAAAVAGGYTKTELEFNADLSALSGLEAALLALIG